MTASDDYWSAVVNKFRKARRKGVRFYRILGREGADARIYGTFYKAVLQATLLFGSYIWVTTTRIGRAFGGFHHGMARCLLEMNP